MELCLLSDEIRVLFAAAAVVAVQLLGQVETEHRWARVQSKHL